MKSNRPKILMKTHFNNTRSQTFWKDSFGLLSNHSICAVRRMWYWEYRKLPLQTSYAFII